jgi:adenylate cyclase
MKYGMVGDDVNLTARVESFTVDGEVLLSRASRDALGDAARVRGPLEARAKGKREPLVMYALVALAAPHDLEVPAEHRAAPVLVDVRVQAECFRVDGKRVAAEPDRATVHRLGLADLELTLDSGPALAVFDSLKLRLHPPHGLGQAPVDELYAKVVAVEPGPEGTCYRLRLTSVPEAGRARLDSWLAST